jgi:hypothetical protein
MKVLTIYLLILQCVVSEPKKNTWVFKKEKDGITVYSRHSDISDFNDLRVEMDLPGTLSQLSSILLDVERYPQWAYATRSCVLIKKISPGEIIYYSEIGTPWPVCNRDFYADFKVTINDDSHTLNVVSEGLKNYQPEKKSLVRIRMSKGVWNVSTVSEKVMHLQYILQLDPGGSVPAWILNMFATRGPMETFDNLKRKMELLNR